MNDPSRSPDDLDRRIDTSLARAFAAPASLDSLAARTRPRPAGRPRVGPWVLLAAATAAGLLLLLRWNSTELGGRKLADEHPLDGARVAGLIEFEPVFCSLVGPLQDGLEQGQIQNPDLVRLYSAMDACQRSAELTPCDESDRLAERLGEAYGQELGLRPEAAGLLHGPFGSDEWPTGTIVTAMNGGHTAVLVADRSDTLDCCVRMSLPENSGLNLFTWRLGEVVLAEITPLDEPLLLPLFH